MTDPAPTESTVAQHTPGPWTVEIIGQDDDGYGHAYITGHITSPLHTYCGNYKGRTDSIAAPDSMTRADAYLIAAAPLLKQACEAIVDVRTCMMMQGVHAHEILEKHGVPNVQLLAKKAQDLAAAALAAASQAPAEPPAEVG